MLRVVLTVIVALIALHATDTMACSCSELPTPEAAFRGSDAVFFGKIISIETRGGDCSEPVAITIQNEGWWSGTSASVIKLLTPGNAGCCGINFSIGIQYLVYAKANTWLGGLSALQCSRTQTLATADEDLEFLGRPNLVLPTEDRTWGAVKAQYDVQLQGI